MFNYFFTIALLFSSFFSISQHIEPQNGVFQSDNTLYALTNVTIHKSSSEKIEKGCILFQNGVILKVGKIIIPKNSVKIDMKGYTIYPSFIEPYSSLGIKKRISKKSNLYPQLKSLKTGPYYWNEAIHPEVDSYELLDDKLLKAKKELVNQGFGTVNTHQNDGVYRGTSVLMTLGNRTLKDNVIKTKVANHYSFSKVPSKQTYPSSQMGSIALLRQFFYDLDWYSSLKTKHYDNQSFESAILNKELVHIFGVADKLEILRVNKIANEFDLPFIVKGGGDEYQRIDEIKATNTQLIIPVNFPKPYDLADPFITRYITLAQLKHWEMAPYNPYLLASKQIEFCFTTDGLKLKKEFLTNIKNAVKHGLSKETALKSLTENPANFLKINDLVGTLEEGKLANFIVVKGDLFEDGVIYENWIQGHKNIIKETNVSDVRGDYEFKINDKLYLVSLIGKPEKLSGTLTSIGMVMDKETNTLKQDTLKSKMQIIFKGKQISISATVLGSNTKGVLQFNGSYYDKLDLFEGNVLLPNGEWAKWSGIKSKGFKDKSKKKTFEIDTIAVNNTHFPNMAFGFVELPEQKSYFIKNATLWTNESQGVIKNANLLIVNGKIKSVNSRIVSIPNGAVIIDAKGKHVTTGIIDEHSHISISKGVNEGGQAISAEVSIADVVRSNDINMYRQLAGGVTTSQLLHGSANPIGGQSALIKLKWGYSPQAMLIDSVDGFIKFALGENVKQANWGDFNRVRFPQTRMGVEQVFYDAFTRAKLYKKDRAKYNGLSEEEKASVDIPRKDLEMEIVLEILESKRFVTCHSYIQSEINMLMNVADSMGFRINTFTHILEGYKLVDKMKKHGAGGSTFSDWWAYKFEVNEAIPYNAAIMHKGGVITALNSDDAEMGRRLNQEAAKVVKYGGVSEEDAWKMVTLNPAKLLHVDDRMGSLKVGKDADIVIWSTNPLSINAKVEQTFIDGILFYDKDVNLEFHQRDQLERKRIINLMIEAKNGGAKTQMPSIKEHKHYHCDTMGE